MPTVAHSIRCPAPLPVTFDFIDDSDKLPDWVIGVKQFTSIGEPAHGCGSRWQMSVALGPLKNDVQLLCTEWTRNSRIVLCAEDERALRIVFSFHENGLNETDVVLSIDYPEPDTKSESALARALQPMAMKAMEQLDTRLRESVAEYYRQALIDHRGGFLSHTGLIGQLKEGCVWMVATISRLRVLTGRDVVARPARSAAAVVVIAVSAALLVAVMATYGSITGSVDRLARIITGNADLVVSGYTDSGIPQQLVGQVAQVQDVRAAIPIVQQQFSVAGQPTLVLGFDLSVLDLSPDLAAIAQGSFGTLVARPDGVVAGPGTGWHTGQRLQIDGRDVTVVRVVTDRAASTLNDGKFVAAPLGLAQRLTNHPGAIDYVMVVARPGADLTSLHDQLDHVVAGKALVFDAGARTVQTANAVAFTRDATLIVAAMSLVVSAFLVFNSMTMVVAQRRPRIAMTRAIGATRRQVVGDLLLEGGLLGAIAAIIGIPIGWLVSHQVIQQVPPFLVQSISANLSFIVPLFTYPAVFVVCVVTSMAATASAAYQASQISPMEALQSANLATAETITQRWVWATMSLGCVVCLGAFGVAFAIHGPLVFSAVAVFTCGGLLIGVAAMDAIARAAARVAVVASGVGRLAAAAIARAPRRAWATAITAGIAVALGVSVNGSLSNIIDAGVKSFAGLRDTQIFVSKTAVDALPNGPLLPPDWRETIRRIPGVAAVGEGQWAYLTLGRQRVAIEGIDSSNNGATGPLLTASTKEDLLRGDGVAISRQLAQRLHYRPGDSVSIGTPTGIHTVAILGIVDVLSVDSGTIVMSVDVMQRWFARPGASYLAVTAAPGADVPALQQSIIKALPHAAYVFTGDAVYHATIRNIEQAGVLAAGLQWIISAIAAVALMNTFVLAVLQRTREFGVLRAIGSSRRLVARLVLIEAAAVGVVGGLLGLALGVIVQYLATIIISRALGITVAFHLSSAVIAYGVGAIIVCILGAVPPAVRSARRAVIPAIAVD